MRKLPLIALFTLALAGRTFCAHVIEDYFVEGQSVDRDIAALEPHTTIGPIAGPQRMLAILVDFPTRPSPVTPAQVVSAYANTVRPFYEEVSYGRIAVPVTDVVGPFAIADSCNLPLQAAFDAADPFVDFRNYDYVSIWGDFNCGWGGIAFLGKVNVQTADGEVLVGTNDDDSGYGLDVTAGINIHELGHNFTVHHAGFLDCGAQTLTASRIGCTPFEYRDPYSDMGNFAFIGIIGYFEPPQRLQAGWLDPTTEVIADPPNGRYTITAHERPEHDIAKALRFPRLGADELWVSARSPIGFDAVFPLKLSGTDIYSGAILTVLDAATGLGKPLLLDAEAPRPDNARVVLLPGMTFTDPDTGVSVTTVSRTGDLLTVDVTRESPPSTTTTVTSTTSTTTTTIGPRCHGNPKSRWCRNFAKVVE